MIAITSISPSHVNGDIQSVCVDSWANIGLKVYSLNCDDEIAILKPIYKNVTFIATHRTMEHNFKKKYVSINAILDFCKELKQDNELFLIINSDIEIVDKFNVFDMIKEKAKSGIVMIKRNDYEETKLISKRYDHGIDAFIIHRNFLHIFPQSVFCMGQTFWDYWIPWHCVKNNVPLFNMNEDFIYHKEHKWQYDLDQWMRLGKYFQWENGLDRFTTNIGKMSNYIYNTFMNYAK